MPNKSLKARRSQSAGLRPLIEYTMQTLPHSPAATPAGLLASFCCLSILLAGCGGSDQLPTAPVRGTVTYNGKPLHTGTVTFAPQTPDAPFAYGEIGPDGAYELTTYSNGDGAVLGPHKIMVSAVEIDPDMPNAVPLIPFKYSSDQTSGLAAEVQPGENVIPLELTSDTPKR